MTETIHMLLTRGLPPLPSTISTLKSYGRCTIVTDAREKVEGEHVVLGGEWDSFREWLGGVDGFWLGEGPPCLEEFKICHMGG